MFKLDDCISFITNRIAKNLANSFEKRLNVYNITRTQWTALYYINANEMITQRQLADKMAIKEPTVVRLLDKMETLNWVVRINSEDDKRTKLLKLTDEGLKIETEMLAVAEKFRDDVVKDISPEDFNTYNSVLNKMQSNIENG